MSDIAPEDLPAEIPSDLLAPEMRLDPQKIAEEAQGEATLADLFTTPKGGGKLPEKKRLVFRDLDAVEAYREADANADLLRGMVPEEPPAKAPKDVKENYAATVAAAEEAEAAAEEARAAMLSTALSFHLRAYPQAALDIAKREARKIFIDPDTKQLRDEVSQEEVQDWMDLWLFGDVVQKVVDSSGRTVDFGVPKNQLGFVLKASPLMHPASWQMLMNDMRELTLIRAIGQSAIEDPGF